MLPGSFIEVRRRCGKPNCRCADGVHLHPGYQLSLLLGGTHRTFHVPAAWADEIRAQVELYKRFQQTASAICALNLRRFLRRKKEAKKQTS